VGIEFGAFPAGQVTLPSSREVVLDYIVERKRMDDLAGSITDGRFNEQKVLYSCPLLPLCMSIKMRTQMEIIQSTPSTLSRVSISEDVLVFLACFYLCLFSFV
jgi:hypothetical protein